LIEFELPGAPPLLLNSRRHHMSLHREKKQWYGWVHIALGRQRPKEPFDRICVEYVRHCGYTRPDRDNLQSGFKWIQDALVLSGVVRDDTEDCIEAYHDWKKSSKKDKKITVRIVPVIITP
jgi:Holliday junction resolvase RusA-like endonuclease